VRFSRKISKALKGFNAVMSRGDNFWNIKIVFINTVYCNLRFRLPVKRGRNKEREGD
jgi:hypothetical protein